MSTPSIQTLITQAQQVLNLKSSNEIRATLAAVLANANVGTPLNPNLTTQQLWDEFYEIVRQPSDDIMSIITDQMMRMVFSPPAPGGAGADKQVIFNDGGVLAGDSKFLWDKNANRLDVDGPVVVTGDLTVDTSTLKVDSTNNRVIVGHTSGSAAFQVTNAGAAGLEIQPTGFSSSPLIQSYNRSGSAYTQLTLDASTIVHALSGTTAMTLNSTGLGIGGSPRAKLDVNGGLLVNNYTTSTNYAPLSVTTASTITTPSTFTNAINIWNPTTVGSYSNITFGYNALGLTNAPAYIGFVSTSSASGGFGDLVFGTRSVGTDTAATERVRIDASGQLLVNTTSVISSSGDTLQIAGKNTAGIEYCAMYTGTSSTVFAARFFHTAAVVGSITFTSTATAYNTSSDYRLKEAVQPLIGGLNRVNALKPSAYNWKVDGSAGEGFLAHELAEVVPFAVTGDKDAVNEDGSMKTQGVDLSKLVPILVAAIQELTARVQTLEAR